MTGTDLYKHTHKSVAVIFEPPCINSVEQEFKIQSRDPILGDQRLRIDREIGR